MEICTTKFETPVGTLLAGTTDAGICLCDFANRARLETILDRVASFTGASFRAGTHSLLESLQTQLGEYFDGTRRDFDLPLVLSGSNFQQQVWRAIATIPFAETRSYKAQSALLNGPLAIRAMARANGENGLAILIPCHRVIGENGSLTGYSGGLHAKRWLLNHEQRIAGKHTQLPLFGAD